MPVLARNTGWVTEIPGNMASGCWECRTELEDTTISLGPKYCGDRCRRTAEPRQAAEYWEGQRGKWQQRSETRNETRRELVRTQEALRAATGAGWACRE